MECYLNLILPLIFSTCLSSAQKGHLPDLQSLDLFKDHPMDIGSLLPDALLADSSVKSSFVTKSNITNVQKHQPSKVVSISAMQPDKHKVTFSIKNAKLSKPPPVTENMTLYMMENNKNNNRLSKEPSRLHMSPKRPSSIPPPQTSTLAPTTTPVIKQTTAVIVTTPPPRIKSHSTDLDISGRVVHQFLPKTLWSDTKTPSNSIDPLSHTLKDSFNIAESSILLSDIFQQPWNRNNLIKDSFILPSNPLLSSRKRKLTKKTKANERISQLLMNTNRQETITPKPSIAHLTSLLRRENTLLNLALGLIKKDKTFIQNALFQGGKSRCPYKPYNKDNRFFMEQVEDAGWIKRRCALGTAYDQDTCECSINVGYQPASCTPEVIVDFNKGIIEDTSENKIPCGVEGVMSLSDLGYFNGASRIIFWRYTNFDFQSSITLKLRFKAEPGTRSVPHPLISNCGTGHDEPSFGVILNSFSDRLTFFVKTVDSEIKFVTFKINPTDWNDVIYSYDGEHLTGKVNGLEKRVSVTGNIEIRSAELTIGQCERYGWFKGFIDDIKIFSCVPQEM